MTGPVQLAFERAYRRRRTFDRRHGQERACLFIVCVWAIVRRRRREPTLGP